MKQLIECVPNISEGRDKNIIDQVTAEIEKVEGVKLLDVDPGMTTNRTVITFVGEPEPVLEAAYRVVKKAAELIDMSQHHGAHPRQGATDVCPLIPVSNITMEEVVEYAHKLGKRLGDELNIPIYCYEEAAFIKERRNLAYCRTGEYESLASRLGTEQWKPDFGLNEWNEHVAHTGATQVGARDFLVAINYNLNTTSTRRANAIAFDVREKGRPMREGGKVNGKPMKDENGNTSISSSMGHIGGDIHQPENYAALFKSGYEAAKSVFPDAKVLVHLDNGFDNTLYNWNLDILKNNGATFDMIGMSVYPYWSILAKKEPTAEKTISDCIENIKKLYEKYNVDIMITETGFFVDESHSEVMEEGKRQLRKLIHESKYNTHGHCKGVIYWEPQCKPSQYKLGAFTEDGRPTAIMEGFLEEK